jgi:hypothetical protein
MRRHLQAGLVDPLKREIYTRIDEYAHSVLLFLWHECNSLLGFHIATTNEHSHFAPSSVRHETDSGKGLVPSADLSFVQERLEQTNAVPQARRKLLLSLIGEIHYIDEMKRLEQHFFASSTSGSPQPQGKTALSDIVPVTGLIVGKLHRLENELRTVVEHWSRRAPAT